MSNLIVIRIVPQSPVNAATFTNYLSYQGGLQITAYDLSFNSPTSGQSVGTAAYVTPIAGPEPPDPVPYNPGDVPASPNYGNARIAQQVDLIPVGPDPNNPLQTDDAYYQYESVATAVIEIPSPAVGQTTFENLRLVATWGSGVNSVAIPVSGDYYSVALTPGPAPDPSQWSSLQPSLYFSLPAPPVTASTVSFTLPSDGTPPPFASLLSAVQSTLNVDPSGPQPNLGKLSAAQCRNIAYEIIWSQQKPLPTPPDPIENLYTDPPNNGVLLSGTTPNQNEGDRQQFEGNLQGYYATANAQADRLAGFVYTLSAAIACSELSLQATSVHFQFPIIVDPGKAPPAGISEATVLLTNGNAPMNPSFAVPAEYFYALGLGLPSQVTPQQQYQMACLASEQQILPKLHHAIDTGIISAPVPPPIPRIPMHLRSHPNRRCAS
ncbi:hypothetical protein [Ktedonobacter robiniae]|uniref:Uncharacterized protein n=1 Tax=Ktedonobacter robiniae TaxID=2778365 RepID=A0ABQ3UTM8_9CHLR|nr:hypothetical protein [Ktedonobacter robiniae]GHO56151.1 hypothetical protein KSB_46260 [Ktedonobacter robiniae]